MSLSIKIFVLTFTFALWSCGSTKEVEKEPLDSSVNLQIVDEALLKSDGYKLGLVKYIENSECSYIIIDVETNIQFDPVNFDLENFKEFKSSNKNIYYQYQSLRRANRCSEARPILLTSIKPATIN